MLRVILLFNNWVPTFRISGFELVHLVEDTDGLECHVIHSLLLLESLGPE